MIFAVIVMLAVSIGLPLLCAARLWRLNAPSRLGFLIVAAEATILVALVALVGRWDMAGYYLRPILLLVFLAALVASFRRHASRPWQSADDVWRRYWSSSLGLVLFGAGLVFVVYGLMPSPGARALAFPLVHQRGFIAQGGGIRLLNHHARHPEQRHALDITALSRAGYRAKGLLPDQLAAYEIWNATVVSPCDGVVAATKADLPDVASDQDQPEGNHVVVDCGTFRVVLAHLQQGSVAVKSGARITAGTPVGHVGNSGNSTEPHLHIHAYDEHTGAGLPIVFDGRTPFRNRVFAGE